MERIVADVIRICGNEDVDGALAKKVSGVAMGMVYLLYVKPRCSKLIVTN